MDKPTTPDGRNASPWPEESGSEQGFGATGVFHAVETPESAEKSAAGTGVESFFSEYRAPEAPKPTPPAARPIAEPVVHKVVLGAGAENSPELLDRIRLASAERASVAEKSPAPASGGQGIGGFTELLRTLDADSAPRAPAPRETPASARPIQESGFTSLLRTLNSPEAATPAQAPIESARPSAPFASPIPESPRPAPAPPSPGGFTELLRTTSGSDAGPGGAAKQPPSAADTPFFTGPPATSSPSAGNSPGAFTQLFGTFSGGSAGMTAPEPRDVPTPVSSKGNAGSFTRLLSIEPQSPAAEPAFREERKPLPGSVNYGVTPGTPGPAAANRDPFAPAPLADAKPVESTPPGGSVGITRLIQMLDEPSKPSTPRFEPAPVSPPRGPEAGAWTQTFASLSAPNESAAPAAKPPSWPPQPPPVASAAPIGREAQFPASSNAPVVHAAAASGPSEFTRILDASRMRELAMRGGSGAASLPQAQTPQAPMPPPPAMPSYPAPVAPSIGGMQGMGAMPQPGVYPPPPPQAPSYPMSYAPPAAAMPQAPGMYAPAPPPMPAPAPPPPAKSADPGAGKLQQLVPLLLVVVIVLLVVLIVTVIFLMKH
jgi:hypothetical protein